MYEVQKIFGPHCVRTRKSNDNLTAYGPYCVKPTKIESIKTFGPHCVRPSKRTESMLSINSVFDPKKMHSYQNTYKMEPDRKPMYAELIDIMMRVVNGKETYAASDINAKFRRRLDFSEFNFFIDNFWYSLIELPVKVFHTIQSDLLSF